MDMPLKRKYLTRPISRPKGVSNNSGKGKSKGKALRPPRHAYGPWATGESLHERCS